MAMTREKSYWIFVNTAKKRMVIVAIICLSLFVTACGYKEFREPIIRQVERLGGEVTGHILEGDVKKIIMHEYQLTVLPDGFEKVHVEGNFKYRGVTYKDENERCIRFYQYAAEEPYFNVMNTWIDKYTVELRGTEVIVYEFPDAMYAIWVEEGYGMSVDYHGTDIDILKEMIESIE